MIEHLHRGKIYIVCFNVFSVRSRRYPARTITNVDYADDITLLTNAPVQAESLLPSLEQAAGYIGLPVNVDKMAYMGNISTRNGCSLKVKVDKFTNLASYREAIGHRGIRPNFFRAAVAY